jgi:hypothetical protein
MSKPEPNGAAADAPGPADGSLGGFESVEKILQVPPAPPAATATAAAAAAALPPPLNLPHPCTSHNHSQTVCPHMQEYIPADKLAHVQRVLYGWNMGKAVEAVPLAPPLADAAEQAGFDLQAYRFEAAPEQLRPPRIVRAGLVQNSIKLPTTAPYLEQRQVHGAGGQRWLVVCCLLQNCAAMLEHQLSGADLFGSSRRCLPSPAPLPLQAIFDRVRELIDAAGAAGVQVRQGGCMVGGWLGGEGWDTRALRPSNCHGQGMQTAHQTTQPDHTLVTSGPALPCTFPSFLLLCPAGAVPAGGLAHALWCLHP